jgi:hypothetical protein
MPAVPLGILTNGIWAQRTGELRWHTAIPILSTGTCIGLAAFARQHAWLMNPMFICIRRSNNTVSREIRDSDRSTRHNRSRAISHRPGYRACDVLRRG